MKRTVTVLCSLALSVAVLGGSAVADEANQRSRAPHSDIFGTSDTSDTSDTKECTGQDSLGLTLLGIPLLGFFFPADC
ncbi:hypothetical protein ACWD0J_40545 [Streptomyces sp. NPDC003011]